MQFPGQTIKAEATTIRKAVPKVVLSEKSKKLTIGKSFILTLKNTKSSVKWSTSDKKVAAIKKISKYKYKVTAKKYGTATITAKVGNKKYTCKVTVPKKVSQLKIKEKEIYNDNGLSITAQNVEKTANGIKFSFVLYNSSKKDYSVAAHSYSVNNLMAGSNLYGLNSVDVPKGKKARLYVEIKNNWLSENNINNIGKLDVIFWTYANHYKSFDTGIVSVFTNMYDKNKQYKPSGKKIYSDDNITVWNRGNLNFEILNKSGYNASYTIENCSVNDWSYELTDYTFDLYSEEIHDDAYVRFKFPISDKFLKENNIKKVKNVEFDVLLEDSYWEDGTIWEGKSKKISINLK